MSRTEPWKPTKAQLQAARSRRLPDLIRPDLDVLFCGINPGLYSAAVGHHFAGPGNRFWPTLHRAGFTSRQLTGFEDAELLDAGFGITNLVARTTATADELSREEIERGGVRLRAKVLRYRPRVVAVVGFGAYRIAFDRKAVGGCQPTLFGEAMVWLLPNPSGLNANHSADTLVRLYRALRRTVPRGT